MTGSGRSFRPYRAHIGIVCFDAFVSSACLLRLPLQSQTHNAQYLAYAPIFLSSRYLAHPISDVDPPPTHTLV